MKRFCLTTALFAILATGAPALTLDAVLQRTADHNPEIQRARLNLEAASGRRLVFHATALPDALIGGVGGVQGGHRDGEDQTTPFGFAYGGLTQPLFNLAVPPARRRGDLDVLIAEQQLNIAMVEHLHAARVAFATALYNRSLKDLRVGQRDRLQSITHSQEARYQAGLTDRGTFVGSQLQTNELSPRVDSAQRAYDGAVLKIVELMGDDLSGRTPLPVLEGNLLYQPVQVDAERDANLARERRADLKLARLFIQAAREDQRIIEANYFPMVNAAIAGEYIPVSDIRRQSQGSPRRSDDIISSEVRIGVAYTWRVVDNGQVYGAAKRQRAIREMNELMVKRLEDDVPRDFARIHNNLDGIRRNHGALSKSVAAAEKSASTVQENMAGGVVPQFEFRMAENASLEVKSALLDLAYQQNLALAEWDRASGRYFQISDETAKSVQ